MKTNILVQYQGGGYDGCFWEWNYFYIDKQGIFHDIQSSGCGGIDNMQDAEQLIEQDKSGTYIYDLNNEQDIETFSKESHPIHVSGVLRWFNDYNAHRAESFIDFFVVCSVCNGQISDIDDLFIEGSVLICNECYYIGECPCCESYVGDTEIVYTGTFAVENEYMNKAAEQAETDGYNYICSVCLEYRAEQIENDEFEDLRWQAFCTGKPDMFSDELRELWV